MIKSIENQRVDVSSKRKCTLSSNNKIKSENEITIPKNSSHTIQKIKKCNCNRKIKNIIISNNELINNKSEEEKNLVSTHSSSGSNSGNESTNKKEFLEKKRRRKKNKYSLSNNKKKKPKQNINEIINKIKSNEIIDIYEIPKNSEVDGMVNNENNINEKFEEKNEMKKNQRKTKINKKELMANLQKKIMENINKEYSDVQYKNDLNLNDNDKKAKFMKKHFPIMFRKDKYYLYTILLKKRRTNPINFIQPQTMSQLIKESQKYQTLYANEEFEQLEQFTLNTSNIHDNNGIKDKDKIIQFKKEKKLSLESGIINKPNKINIPLSKNFIEKNNIEKNKKNLNSSKNNHKNEEEKNNIIYIGISESSSDNDTHMYKDESENINQFKLKKSYDLLPKKIWSMPDEKKLDIEEFFEDCIQIWPFKECAFIKEIALEFLMMNNYSQEVCLNRKNDFISFMKKRALELDFSIDNKNEKTVKNYSLRKTKYN